MKPGFVLIAVEILITLFSPFTLSAQTNLDRCEWHASTGAQWSLKGNLGVLRVSSLPHPEPRTIECWASLPGNQQMVVRGSNRGAVTQTGWTFAFERASGVRRELNRSSQEGAFAFPVPASWEHDKRVGILIGIPGDNPGYVRFQDLSLVTAPGTLPSVPRPVSPEDGQEVTPPAADFLWLTPHTGSVSGYDLAWQRVGGKSETMHIAAYFVSGAQGVWPAHWLAPGRYSWRVCALNPGGKPGPWSRARHFTVRAEAARQAPDVVPSTKHPLFLVNLETSDPETVWKRVPADVRSRLMIRIGGSLEQIQHTLEEAQREGIPIALQVNGPHNIIAGRWDRVPLARLAQWAHQYSELKAFYICEQEVQGGMENPEVKSYLERLIDLGSELGRPVFWADANWGGNIWLDVVASKDFSRFLRAHRGYLYPLWKMNGGYEPYLAPAGLLGLWLSHTVAAWGAQAESWYWVEAGFTTLGIQHGYKGGVRENAPPVLYQQLALLGASAGAEIYSFEPAETDFFGPNSGHNLESILLPLIRMLTDSVIPSFDEVQAAVVKQRALEPADLIFRNHYTTSMHQLFSRTLGITYPYEEVPESGACYWIPFLPPGLTAVTAVSSCPAEASSKACPPPVPGNAAVFKVGKTDFIFNSRVNWPGEERFSLRLAGANLCGKLGLNGWVVIRTTGGGEARLWFFARTGARLDMEFDRPVTWHALTGSGNQSGVSPLQHESALPKPAARFEAARHIELRAGRRPWEIVIRQLPEGSR